MLSVTLLGEQAVVDATTGEVRTRASRTIALLAYLVAHAGAPQPRARIAGTFWPGSGDRQALTNLRRELHTLRDLLGADGAALETTSTHLTWSGGPQVQVDVVEFRGHQREALAARAAGDDQGAVEHGLAALERYGGPLLPGIDDEWVLELRADLDRACLEVCDVVCAAAVGLGRPERALPAARLRVGVAPTEETGYRTLMDLQVRTGDRAGAVTTYHRCASVLEQELGLDPDPATTRLFERLLGGAAASAQPERARTRHAPLVARDDELATLIRAWEATEHGHSRTVVLQGPPGTGKSRLATELAARVAAGGAAVATAECVQGYGQVSLAPVAQWLRSPAVATARRALDPLWQREVDRLVPSRPGPDPGSPPVDVWQRHRFFDGLAQGLLAVARPTLLVLEDAHWCDEDTRAFCSMLLRTARARPVLLLVTVRDSPDPGTPPWPTDLAPPGRHTTVPVDPLDPAGTCRLAEALTGTSLEPETAALLHAATGGFPLYVQEACRSSSDLGRLLATSTRGFAHFLRRRLDRCSPAARSVAGLASAVGRAVDLTLLCEASDLDADTVVLAVDELWGARILREHEGGYAFTHDRLREAAYDLVTPARRWLLHRRLAQALELLHAGHTDEVAAQVAAQYDAAGNRARALMYYQAAGRTAASVFAHVEAVTHFRTALRLLDEAPPTRDRHEQQLACLQEVIPPLNALHGYSSPELGDVCTRAAGLAAVLGARDARLTATVGLWACRFVQGDMTEARRVADEVLSLVDEGDALLGQARLCMAGSAMHLGDVTLARRHFAAALEVTGTDTLCVGTRASVHTAAWAAHAAWLAGDPEEAARLADGAVHEARASGHQYSLAVALAYAGITRQLLGDRGSLPGTARELQDLCERCGFAYYGEWGRILDGWCRGPGEGELLVRQGLDSLREQGAGARSPYWLALLADLARRPEDRRTVLLRAESAALRQQELWWLPEIERRLSRLEADGEDRLQRAAATARHQGSVTLLARCEHDLHASGPARTVPVAPGER